MRLLITGASGLLGSNLVLAAVDAGHQVFATSLTKPIHLSNVGWRAADLTTPEENAALMNAAEPDWVIHCAAATDVDQCEADQAWAFELNRDMARNVAEASREAGAIHVHISTDAVFDGGQGSHAESDEATPINTYGLSKLEGEQAVVDANPQAAIVRTNIYGWSPPGRTSLAEWFLAHLRQGKPTPGFADIQINPLLANQLSALLLDVLAAGLSGIYHIASRDSVTKYELGARLADVFELDADLIQPTESEQAGLKAARPKDLSLEVGKIERDLGVQMPNVNDGVMSLRRHEQEGYRERLHSLLLERAQS